MVTHMRWAVKEFCCRDVINVQPLRIVTPKTTTHDPSPAGMAVQLFDRTTQRFFAGSGDGQQGHISLQIRRVQRLRNALVDVHVAEFVENIADRVAQVERVVDDQ